MAWRFPSCPHQTDGKDTTESKAGREQGERTLPGVEPGFEVLACLDCRILALVSGRPRATSNLSGRNPWLGVVCLPTFGQVAAVRSFPLVVSSVSPRSVADSRRNEDEVLSSGWDCIPSEVCLFRSDTFVPDRQAGWSTGAIHGRKSFDKKYESLAGLDGRLKVDRVSLPREKK